MTGPEDMFNQPNEIEVGKLYSGELTEAGYTVNGEMYHEVDADRAAEKEDALYLVVDGNGTAVAVTGGEVKTYIADRPTGQFRVFAK